MFCLLLRCIRRIRRLRYYVELHEVDEAAKVNQIMRFRTYRLLTACVVVCLYGVCVISVTQVRAQSSVTEPAKSSSSELIGQLAKGLSITRPQARGGSGALFALAKSRLSAEEFGKVSAVVPGMSGLLKAAPERSEFSSLETSLPGNMGRMAEVAEAFHKLGLSPEMAAKFVPVMTRFVESKGGLSTASLLEKALK